jgi:hypothetical protein
MLDGALSSIDQHKGTLSLLSGSGLDVKPASGAPESPTRDEVAILGAASSLTPAQRAKLLDAAKKNDPLAQAQAKIASRTPGKPGVNAPSNPAPSQDAPGLDPSLLSALRALGMDPSALDLKSLDIDALLAKARERTPQ